MSFWSGRFGGGSAFGRLGGGYGLGGAYGTGAYGAGGAGCCGAGGTVAPYGSYGPGGAYGAGGADCGTACCASTTACMGCGPGCGVACAEGSGCGSGAGGGTILSYVGPGGDFVQETTYKYVGMGAGEFGPVRIPGRGPNCCLICLVPLGLSLLALPFLFFAMQPGSTTTTTTTTTTTRPVVTTPTAPPDVTTTSATTKATTKAPTTTQPPPTLPPTTQPPPTLPPTTPPPTTTTPKINCGEGDAVSWDVPKKVYCCLHEGKGCPTTPEAPSTMPVATTVAPVVVTTSSCPIDCNAGYNDLDPLQWVRGWSGEKKLYCCKTANKGCPSELPPPSGLPQDDAPPEPDNSVYDCDAGYHHCMHCLELSWSPQKIAYCCKNQHKGCKGEEPE